MKTAIYIIIALALVALVVTLVKGKDEGSVERTEIEGRIVNIDLEQAAFDGPYVIVVEEEDGADQVVHVPSMGMALCAARDNIVSPSELSVGMEIEVMGTLTAQGVIVPCESPDHYVRVGA